MAVERQPVKTTLSQEERLLLHGLKDAPGYHVLLRLMEMACIMQDGVVMSVAVEDEKKIVAEQRVAVAKWAFFAEIQKQVAFETGELEPDPQPTGAANLPEEEPIENILSAIP